MADGIKINSARTAAVDQTFFWKDASTSPPPRGVRLLVISEKTGVATISQWSDHFGWSHWAGLPKFREAA
jgi:hypothetical protein